MDKESPRDRFPTTSWTLIRTVQQGEVADATRAMEEICRQYWYPIYAFNRRQGFPAADAEDLTQDFFRALIARETIQAAREEKGRLRSFILNMLREMNAKHLRSRYTEKRGGRVGFVPLHEVGAEERYCREPAGIEDAARLFDRAWAELLLAGAKERLRADFAAADNLEEFEQLREYLPLEDETTPYAEAARRLGIPDGALRLQIHRMRKRFGKHVRTEIAQTVNDPDEQKEELTYLLAVLEDASAHG